MSEQSAESVVENHTSQCEAAITAFKRDLQKMKTGRASTGLVEGIEVDYYGSKTQLSHLGQISTPEARTIVVQVFDAGALPAIEKAIQSSQMGFNPSREGNTIRINVPALTEDSRKEIVKMLSKMAEDIRVSIRNHRREANDRLRKLEKEGVVAKDDTKRFLEQIQKITDNHIAEVDSLLQAKEAECMEV